MDGYATCCSKINLIKSIGKFFKNEFKMYRYKADNLGQYIGAIFKRG